MTMPPLTLTPGCTTKSTGKSVTARSVIAGLRPISSTGHETVRNGGVSVNGCCPQASMQDRAADRVSSDGWECTG
jgi:hypothetical protein